MTYSDWSTYDNNRKTALVAKLTSQGKSTADIVEYFNFDNMVSNEPNYCELFKTNTKCHNMTELNCFFCGCPHFIYDDKGLSQRAGKTVYSKCAINAVKGSEYISDKTIHQDCSNCEIPHKLSFVLSNIRIISD